MEVTEGNIRVTQTPCITIGDVSLGALISQRKDLVIGRAIMALVKKVGEQRETIIALREQLDES